MATTQTELYRPFTGHRGRPRRAWLALGLAGVRTALKKKLPLLLLYAPPAIATVIFSFVVYAKFALEAGITPSGVPGSTPGAPGAPGGALVNMISQQASRMIEVSQQIVLFNFAMRTFALLAVGWYGAGLIAEDRRLGAHLLYFARPIRRLDYVAGKLLTVSVFGLFTALVPVLVICIVAIFASPDYSFLLEKGDVIANSVLYALIWVLATGSLVLAASSLAERKSFALVAFFGVFMLTQAVAVVVTALRKDPQFLVLGLASNLERIGHSLLDWRGPTLPWPASWSWAIVAGVTVGSLAVAMWRTRRLEVVR